MTHHSEFVRQLSDALSTREKWVKGHYAGVRLRQNLINGTSVTDPRANCFCLAGAAGLARARIHELGLPPVPGDFVSKSLEDYRWRTDDPTVGLRFGISSWNDDPKRTYEDVMHFVVFLSERARTLDESLPS